MSLLTILSTGDVAARPRAPIAACLVMALFTGCARPAGRGAAVPASAAPALAEAESGPRFLTPPQPNSAKRLRGGEVEIDGSGPAGATVSLKNPDGAAFNALVTAQGAWSVRLPSTARPRLYALSATLGARTLRGEGALLQAPAPAPAALLLRAGAPSVALDVAEGGLRLASFDFDGAGGLAVAGLAPARAALRLSLDGRPAAAGQADGSGRFALMAVQGDLKPGTHVLHLEGGGRQAGARVDATPSRPSAGRPYAVRPVEGGWRVDWSIPGGGAQSSVIFASRAEGAGA